MFALSPILSCYRYTSLHLPIRTRVGVTQPPYALLPCLCSWEACVTPVASDVLLEAERGCEEEEETRGVNVTVSL